MENFNNSDLKEVTDNIILSVLNSELNSSFDKIHSSFDNIVIKSVNCSNCDLLNKFDISIAKASMINLSLICLAYLSPQFK